MKINRVLQNAVIAGVFLVPFIPLIVVNDWFFPFITGKNYAFRIIVEIVFALWLVLAVRTIRFRPSFSWITVSVGVFVLVIGIADLLGENPFKSFWSNFERMEGFLTLLHIMMYFIVLGTTLQTKRIWGWLAHTSVGVSVVIGLWGLMQLSGIAATHGTNRIDASLGNATYMAVYMLFHIFITAMLLYWRRQYTASWFSYGAVIFLQSVVLYYTETRGAILGLFGGIFIGALLLAILNWKDKRVRAVSVGILATLVLLAGGFFALKDSSFVQGNHVLQRFASISLEQGTVQTRFTIWGMAWKGFLERPVIGWGQENFNFVFNKYYKPTLYGQEAWFDRAHNIIFDWLIAGGSLGFLSYSAIAFFALFYVWRPSSPFSRFEKSAITALFAAYGFHNLFVFDNIVSYILYFSVLAYIYARTRESVRPGTLSGTYIEPRSATRVLVPLLSVILVFSVYFFNIRGMVVSSTIIDALRAQQAGNFETSLERFKNATSIRTTGRQESREQLAQSATRIAQASGIDISIKQKYFDASRLAMEDLIEAVPNDARTRVFYGTLFSAYGQHARATEQFIKAHELSPRKQQLLFTLGRSYINERKFGKALETLKTAFKLAPEYDKARALYAAAAMFDGRNRLADELLIERWGTTTVDDNDLIRAYSLRGFQGRVLAIIQRRVRETPNEIQPHIALAYAYLDAGEIDRAIDEIRSTMEKFPDFVKQGEQLIKEIQSGKTRF